MLYNTHCKQVTTQAQNTANPGEKGWKEVARRGETQKPGKRAAGGLKRLFREQKKVFSTLKKTENKIRHEKR